MPEDAVIAAAGEISGSRDLPVRVDGAQGFVGKAPRAVRIPELDAAGRRVAPKDAVIAAASKIPGSRDLPVRIDGAQGFVAKAA